MTDNNEIIILKSEPPTPIALVREVNNTKLNSLSLGASTKLNWEDKDIRVTVTMSGKLGFYEEDILRHLELTDEQLPAEKKLQLREEWDGIAFDAGDRLLILEPGIYLYAFWSSTDASKRFVKWVCSDVLPSIRACDMFTTSKDAEGNERMSRLLSEIEMHNRVTLDRLAQNHKTTTEEVMSEVKTNMYSDMESILTEVKSVNEQLTERMAKIDERMAAVVDVVHDHAAPKQQGEYKQRKPRKKSEPLVTEEQQQQFLVMHEQLACAVGNARVAGDAIRARYATKHWDAYSKQYKISHCHNIAERVALIVRDGHEQEGGVDALLDCVRDVLDFSGLTPVTVDAWQEGLDIMCRTPEVAKRDITEYNDSNNFGSNLQYIPVSDISLKPKKK